MIRIFFDLGSRGQKRHRIPDPQYYCTGIGEGSGGGQGGAVGCPAPVHVQGGGRVPCGQAGVRVVT